MIELLDYLLDEEDNFWIVNAIYDNVLYGAKIYQVDENGNRYNNITKKKYKKYVVKDIIEIPKYKRIFKARDCYIEHKNELDGIWKEYINSLNEIGIMDKDIGIFGSLLIGFDIIKDVDFVIYGEDNLKKYLSNKENINKKLNVSNITPEHIEYQCEKFKEVFSEKTDIKKIISRNITGIQIKEGVLSTPRFIDNYNINIPTDNGVREILNLKVIDSIRSSLFPRRAKVLYNDEEYELISPVWKYESFLRTDDNIRVRGSIHKDMKKIILYSYDDYVEFV